MSVNDIFSDSGPSPFDNLDPATLELLTQAAAVKKYQPAVKPESLLDPLSAENKKGFTAFVTYDYDDLCAGLHSPSFLAALAPREESLSPVKAIFAQVEAAAPPSDFPDFDPKFLSYEPEIIHDKSTTTLVLPAPCPKPSWPKATFGRRGNPKKLPGAKRGYKSKFRNDMAPDALRQRQRQHNMLLLIKTLNQHGTVVSPFTLILDDLEQSGRPLLQEFIHRSTIARRKYPAQASYVIFVSFETLNRPCGVDDFVPASGVPPTVLQQRIQKSLQGHPRSLILIDSLYDLMADSSINPAHYLSAFIQENASIAAVYHQDMPLAVSPLHAHEPSSLELLKYISTCIITVQSLHHTVAAKLASERSVAAPVFGLGEEVDGVLQGLGANDKNGYVIHTEFRRKSGREVRDSFFLPHLTLDVIRASKGYVGLPEAAILLEDHPLFQGRNAGALAAEAEEAMTSTFELGLTEKQRREREGVVLPYFDAQKEEGGEGGRILYEMGVEDDFDEEEDEI